MRAPSLCSLVAVMLAPVLLAGCQLSSSSSAPSPLPVSYPLTTQQRLQAAEHWALLARYEAEKMLMNERMRILPLYIQPAGNGVGGDFFRSYHDLLTTALVARGARISTVPDGAAEVRVLVETIQHRDRDLGNPPSVWPKLMRDWFYGNGSSAGNDEVVITTQVLESSRVLYSGSNRYYINEGDRRHYVEPATTGRPLLPVFPVTNRWY